MLARLAPRDDAGFTLVEVMAALVVFSLVAAATLAMLLTGLRSSLVNKQQSVGKNVTQERVEQMRTLQYHNVSNPSQGLVETYYPNNSGGVGSGQTGFVAAGGGVSSDGDPAAGAFYRTVVDPVSGFAGFRQYVAVQFLDANGASLDPPAGYNILTSGTNPPSNFVGFTVTTFWTVGGRASKFSTYTRAAASTASANSVTVQSRTKALRIQGNLPSASSAPRKAFADAGIIEINGALADDATAASTATGGQVSIPGGDHTTGATATATAPPNTTQPTQSLGGFTFVDTTNSNPATNTVLTLGPTDAQNVNASSTAALPGAGTPTQPVTADVYGQATPNQNALGFTNEVTAGAGPVTHLMLNTATPVVTVPATSACPPTCSAPVLTGSSYMQSTLAGANHTTTTSSSTSIATAVRLFPTTFAPNGVLSISLSAATIQCQLTGPFQGTPTPTLTATYTGSVSYSTYDPVARTYTPRTVSLSGTQSADALAAIPLATTQVGVDGLGAPIYLGDYVSSWGSATSSSVAASQQVASTGKALSSTVDSLIFVNSAPLRASDASSGLGVQVGGSSCLVGDSR